MRSKWKKGEELNFWQPASALFSALFLVSLLLVLLLGLNQSSVPEHPLPDPNTVDSPVDIATVDESVLTDEADSEADSVPAAPVPATPVPVTAPSPDSPPIPTSAATPDDPGGETGDGPGAVDGEAPKGAVYVMLTDAETGLTVRESGVRFELYGEDGALRIMDTYYPEHTVLQTYETAETGGFFFPEKLKAGVYFLHQLSGQEGYDTAEYQRFSVEAVHDWSDPLVVSVPVFASRSVICVQMTDAETGGLVSGGSFDVIADEDIVTADGSVRLRKGQVAARIAVDEEGFGTSEPVYLGRYILRQHDIPEFCAALREDIPVVAEKGSGDPPTPYMVTNLRTRVRFSLTDELYPTKAVAGAVFRVTADRGSFTPLDVSTDADGSFVLDGLPRGATYRIRQLTAPGDYQPSAADYTVTVDAAGYIDGSSEVHIEATNRMLRVLIGITDELSSVQIPNVNLALFDMDGALIRTWNTSGNPQTFTELRAGSYYLIKDLDPAQRYDINVADQAEIQKINIHTTYVLQYVIVGTSAAAAAVCAACITFVVRRRKKKARAQTGL